MAEAATPVATEDQTTYEEAPPLPRYPTGIRDSIPAGEPVPETAPVDPTTAPPKFPSMTDVGLANVARTASGLSTSAISDGGSAKKLGAIQEETEEADEGEEGLGQYTVVEEVGEDGETETARALRREAEREKQDAEEIHELIRRSQVPFGTGEMAAFEAGKKEWTEDDQTELERLLREDSDEYIPKDSTEDDAWILRKRRSESSVVTGVTRLSSEPILDGVPAPAARRGAAVGAGVVLTEGKTEPAVTESRGVGKAGAALIVKDEVVPPKSYTSTYNEYHSKMGAKVDVSHDYGLSGGHSSGVEDVVFLDADTLITAGTDGKVCIWDLNERYVKTEFEPYDNAEPASMIQVMPSGEGAKGVNFLTLSKKTRIMRIWNVVGDSAILMRSMQIPASKNDLVMSLPVFSPSREVYPTES